MKCLFVHQSAELYGSDRVLLALVVALRDRSAYEPIVLLPEDGPLVTEFQRHGVEVHVVPLVKVSRAVFTPAGLLRLVVQIPRSLKAVSALVKDRKIDVVHTNTLAMLTGALWAKLHRVPHVWHVHEIIVSPKVVAWGFPVLLRLLADRVVSISRMTQENLVRRQPALAPISTIVWNGLEVPALLARSQTDPVRAELGAQADELLVALVGRINHWKGHHLLLQAAEILFQRAPQSRMRLVFVGSTAKGQEHLLVNLQREIERRQLQGRVIVKEFVNDIWPIWTAVDVAVVPSTEPEPFGMVAIEAMAVQKPVIAAQHGGLLDIIEDRRSGFFFRAGDAEDLARVLGEVTSSPALRKTVGEQARTRVEAVFSLNAQADAFRSIYDELAVAT